MGLRQGKSASGFCRSTNGPDAVDDRCIRAARRRGQPAARRSRDRSSCGTRSGKTRPRHAMEALADAIGLWALGLGTAVINVLDGEIELALGAAKLGAAVGQH